MTRFHTTTEGNVPFTPEEEAEWDSEQAEYAATVDDRAAAKVRTERDSKLAATDWTASTDVTMTPEMTDYRQALRDVPAQAGFPSTVAWPTSP